MTEGPLELARRLADAFEARKLPYALGGALAFNQYGPPRSTKDVDFNVFVDAGQAAAVCAVLAAEGLRVDAAAVARAAAEGAHGEAWAGTIRVDIFFNSIPLHDSAAARTLPLPLLGRPAATLSAEDVVVFKLLFFRGKDMVDVEHLVGVQRDVLDRGYIRRWLLECVGEDDPRVARWDAISAALP